MIRIFTLVTILLTLSISSFGQVTEEKNIKAAFNNYKASILNDKGVEAVKYVDRRTLKYYGEMLDLVKNAEREQVEQLSIVDKVMVFSVRHRTSKEEIFSFDGRGLFVYAIKSGMVGKNSDVNTEIGKVVVEGDFAKGQFISNGKETPLYFHFYKEEGEWKIDLTEMFPMAEMALKKMVDDSGLDESAYIFRLLEMLTGNAPRAEIWNPVNKE